jgi:hypothetical protein
MRGRCEGRPQGRDRQARQEVRKISRHLACLLVRPARASPPGRPPAVQVAPDPASTPLVPPVQPFIHNSKVRLEFGRGWELAVEDREWYNFQLREWDLEAARCASGFLDQDPRIGVLSRAEVKWWERSFAAWNEGRHRFDRPHAHAVTKRPNPSHSPAFPAIDQILRNALPGGIASGPRFRNGRRLGRMGWLSGLIIFSDPASHVQILEGIHPTGPRAVAR